MSAQRTPTAALGGDDVDDVYLVGRAAAGDRDAFAELYDRHAPLVLGLLTRMLGREEAEEVLQEAFLQAWRQAARYRAELAAPRGWLVTIARSRALDRLRSRRTRETREETVGRERPLAVDAAATSAAAEERESRERVRAALAGIPVEQRRCIELAFYEGLTHSEIAARLDAPLGTVKSRILLGMNRLRQSLGALAPGLRAETVAAPYQERR